MSRIQLTDSGIFIDGVKTQIFSGAIHYFRVPEPLWDNRLYNAAQMGLNCIETYIPWNRIEPEEGEFMQDALDEIRRFAAAVAKNGMLLILRPGPYICAEYDNGGFPYWLMNKPGIKFRRRNKPYQDAVENFFNRLMPVLKSLEFDNGGPLIMLQVENEYGSYCNDTEYIKWLTALFTSQKISVPLFTADGNENFCISNGQSPDIPEFLTGGSRLKESVDLIRARRPDSYPFFIEFWCGWFDAWGYPVVPSRTPEEIAKETDELLETGASVNIYMCHGGSHFGYIAGANIFAGKYSPDTSSYDYFAPLNEQGNPTPLFYELQKVIKKYRPDFTPKPVIENRASDLGTVKLTRFARLFEHLPEAGRKFQQISPETMESMGQANGFALYSTTLRGQVDINGENGSTLEFYGIHDRAWIYLDGKLASILYRNDEKHYCAGSEAPALSVANINIPKEGMRLDVLVEGFGHVNYGPDTGRDFKGLVGDVCLNRINTLINWDVWSLPMDKTPEFTNWDSTCTDLSCKETPIVCQGEFNVDAPADTFIKFPGKCGQIWINSILLGRYWDIGPETSLFLPSSFLKKGKNTITILEAEQLYGTEITLR